MPEQDRDRLPGPGSTPRSPKGKLNPRKDAPAFVATDQAQPGTSLTVSIRPSGARSTNTLDFPPPVFALEQGPAAADPAPIR